MIRPTKLSVCCNCVYNLLFFFCRGS